MRLIVTFMLVVLAGATGYSNGRGIAYYVLRTTDAKDALTRPQTESPDSLADLQSRSLLHGYFIGSCHLYMKTKDFQFRIEAGPTELMSGATHEFRLSMFSQVERRHVFQCAGFVKIDKSLCAPKDWQVGEFTVLFKEIIFKK